MWYFYELKKVCFSKSLLRILVLVVAGKIRAVSSFPNLVQIDSVIENVHRIQHNNRFDFCKNSPVDYNKGQFFDETCVTVGN